MIFRQLFDPQSSTYTYLLADPATREALLRGCQSPTPQSASAADRAGLNLELEELNGAVADEDLAAVANSAKQLRETLAGLVPSS